MRGVRTRTRWRIGVIALAAACGGLGAAATSAGAASAAVTSCGFPKQSWQRVEPNAVDLDAAKLQAALDFAMTRSTSAIAVYRHGCLAGEDRAASVSNGQTFQSFSMAKSVTSLLTGRAVTLGYLSVDDPIGAFMPEADRAHGALTVRDLLTMSSGLHWNFYRDYNVFTPGDRVKDALTLPFDHKPGTWYEYHQSPVTLMAKVVERAVGQEFQKFAQEQLFTPLGIPPGSWEWGRDDAGNTLGFHDLNMTRDDFARLGYLMQRGGVWNGRRLIAADYVRQTISPSKANPGYGYMWWLNCCKPYVAPTVPDRDIRNQRLVESAPPDMYTMAGFQEQRVMVFPGLDLLMVRTGVTGDRDQDLNQDLSTSGSGEFEHELVRRLMRAVLDVTVQDPGPYTGARNAPSFDPDYGLLKSSQEFQLFLTPPGTDVALGPAGPRRARAIVIRSRGLRVRRGGRWVRVKLACPAQKGRDCKGRLTLAVTVSTTRTRRVAARNLSMRSGRTRKVSLRLGRRARRLIARHRALAAKVTTLNRDDAGGARSSRDLVLRRARAKRAASAR
ncbi:MAG TPA: serine hydrolase [Thermoleophilaceae bacterium]|jgi:CubicO group peptidase (beta-lactamase class C family)